MKNILFTTSYITNKLYDYWQSNTHKKTILRYSWTRYASYGLRFLQYNIPQINILEYPTLDQFKQIIDKSKIDILGFSFYTNEIPQILEMVKYARIKGVKVIWAGNYGALTSGLNHYFNKIFKGYSEKLIADELGIKIHRIKHPPIIQYYSWAIGMKIAKVGILQTARGCLLKCKFCQTPVFSPKTELIPMESIKEVLLEYKKRGVKEIIIIDESFGLFKNHANAVIELLYSLGFYWSTMTRVDILYKNLDSWISKGLFAAFIGIESFSQNTLDFINKNQTENNALL